ncbi:MAG: thiamine pyrophosphate-dependent dehydrogenase E1 component subunit alpha, partial [Planctomycetota bacterium]
YLIRACEEKIVEHYFEDEMKTPMHMSMGAEAISVGICHVLKPEDHVFGTYRSHALFLAKTGDTDDFFAEMYGKDTSSLKGKGGSMHLCSPDHGFMGASAIVVAVFFGDGAVDEGSFWESFNAACLMKLPILFVCEDNGLAVHVPKACRRGYSSIIDVVSNFNCIAREQKTTDAEAIYELTSEMMETMKSEQKPGFLRLEYCRYLEHVGVCQDFEAGYRSVEEFEEWHKIDPITLQREKLQNLGYQTDNIRRLEVEIEEGVSESFSKAKNAGFCDVSELYKEVLV